jgi:Uncharacterised nucleotidyltransferase
VAWGADTWASGQVDLAPARAIGETLLWASRSSRTSLPPELPADATAAVVKAASFHRVAPILRDALENASAAADPDLLTALNGPRTVALLQHLQALADLPGLIDTFARAGVPWAMMKGPVIAALGYGDPTLRGYVDLDVLVRSVDLEAVLQALLADGAEFRTTDWAWASRTRQCEVGLVLPYGNHLDLHWHPVNNAAARAVTAFDVDAALAVTRPVTVADGITVPALNAVDNLITVAVHAAWSGGHLLGWSKDIERLLSADPCTWDHVVSRARQTQMAVPVALMLRRVKRLLDASVPDGVIEELVAGHPWSVTTLWMERLASPRTLGQMRWTAQGVVASTRDSARATALSMSEEMRAKLLHAVGIRSRDERHPPAVDDSASAFQGYLDAVTRGVWSRALARR